MTDFYGATAQVFVRNSNARPTCAYCGTRGLVWKKTAQGWRLADSNTGAIHACREYRKGAR